MSAVIVSRDSGCEQHTVASCVFRGHEAAGRDRHDCPLVQVLVRRLHDLGIGDKPAYADREIDKYRSLARVLGCPLLTRLSPHELSPSSASALPAPQFPSRALLRYDR